VEAKKKTFPSADVEGGALEELQGEGKNHLCGRNVASGGDDRSGIQNYFPLSKDKEKTKNGDQKWNRALGKDNKQLSPTHSDQAENVAKRQ